MALINLSLKQFSPTSVQLQHPEFSILVDRPKEKGGGGTGLMGGQYLLTGIGGCYCSTLFAAAQARNITIEGLRVEIVANLSEELPKRFSKINLKVSYDYCSTPEAFGTLLTIAEKGCISVNTIKNGMKFSCENIK